MEEEGARFIATLEEKHGGTITWKTYATWFGASDGTEREFGVFLYRIGDTFYYEDFERRPSILGYALKPSKKTPPYEKLEGSFSVNSVCNAFSLSKKKATSCLQGTLTYQELKPASALTKLFSRIVISLVFDHYALFFEVLDRNYFSKLIKE